MFCLCNPKNAVNLSLKRSLLTIVRALQNCFQGVNGVHFLLYDEDLAKSGMLVRIPLMMIRQTTLSKCCCLSYSSKSSECIF